MIAKIITSDKREYYSTVFAICPNNWNSAVIVFDDEKDEFSFMKIYSRNLIRNVFIIDCNDEEFVKERIVKINPFKTVKNIEGYTWLVDNRELFLNVIKNKSVDNSYKEKARALNKSIKISEWMLVQNEQDVKNLMSTAVNFHDGIIDKVVYNNESDSLEITFKGCWNSQITLLFEMQPLAHVSFENEFGYYVMNSSIFFEDGFIYWVDAYNIKSVAELTNGKDMNYFRGRALKWKQQINPPRIP